MRFFNWLERVLRAILPSPLSIAILLTLIVIVLAITLGDSHANLYAVSQYWSKGIWESNMLVFALQMILMLVLGHVLALTGPVDRLIRRATIHCSSTAQAAFIVTFLTVLMSFLNWGLGLIFGAVLARKVGEHAEREGINMNYGLIGAAGYSGLMVWHGGLSGSAPIKVAEEGHLRNLMDGSLEADQIDLIPTSISLSETVLSSMNISSMIALIALLPIFMWWLGKRFPGEKLVLKGNDHGTDIQSAKVEGAERLDHWGYFSKMAGAGMLAAAFLGVDENTLVDLSFITPNFINLVLFGLALTFHKNIAAFLKAIDQAIVGSSGIVVQFPLYFGIMGIMSHSGLIDVFSDFFISISTPESFPLFSFFSAGIVNLFVPSGGGQWGVQGPIVIKAALDLGIAYPKVIMALAYGDQLTNMLQPFWALPLLGITGLSARSILPYSVMIMFVGILIFSTVLILF